MDLNIRGRTALITGASKGIGLASAECLAQEGVNVILVSDPTNNPEIAAYEFYRNEALTDLAGSVSASPPVRFEDHRRKKGVSYTYYIVSVDIYGDRELQGSFTLNP